MSRLEAQIRQELNLAENKTRIDRAKRVNFAPDLITPVPPGITVTSSFEKSNATSTTTANIVSSGGSALRKSKDSGGEGGEGRGGGRSVGRSIGGNLKATSNVDKFIIEERKKNHSFNVPTILTEKDDANKHSGIMFSASNKKLVLDTEMVKKTLNEEYPNDLLLQGQALYKIGDLREVKEIVENIRRLDISFNPFTNLSGLEQFVQLRHLYGYGCNLKDLAELQFVNKVECLLLQQNKVKKLETEFLSFKKLRELRLDRNELTSIDNLHCCTALRILDLSWNKIESIEGLAGLQSLTELRLNNNCIDSLVSFRALPSLTELNVSYNKLKSLEGIQMLPTLMSINASCNEITTLRIPQTYSHQNKALDKTTETRKAGGKDDKALVGDKSKKGSGASAAPATVIGKLSSKGAGAGAGAVAGSTASIDSSSIASASASAPVGTLPRVATLGMPNLCEVILRDNKLTNLAGIDTLGLAIETLDVSYNQIALRIDVVANLRNLYAGGKKENALLNDLKLQGNPLIAQLETSEARLERELETIAESLIEICPKIELLNDCKIVVEYNSIHKGKALSPEKQKQEGRAPADFQTQFTVKILKPEAVEVHKWAEPTAAAAAAAALSSNKDLQSANRAAAAVAGVIAGGGKGKGMGDGDQSDDDILSDPEGDEFDAETNKLNQRRKAPKLFLKDMNSFDTVSEKENNFKDILDLTRKTLGNIYNVPSDSDLDYKALSATYHKKIMEDAAEKMAAAKKSTNESKREESSDVAKIIALMKYAKREKKPIVVNRRAPWEDKQSLGPSEDASEKAAIPEPLFVSRKVDQASQQLSARQMLSFKSNSNSRGANSFYLTGDSPRLDSSRAQSARSAASDAPTQTTDTTMMYDGRDSKQKQKGLYVPEEFSKSIVSAADNKRFIMDWLDSKSNKSSSDNGSTAGGSTDKPKSRPRSAKEFSVGFDLRAIVANLDAEPNPAMLVNKAHSARELEGTAAAATTADSRAPDPIASALHNGQVFDNRLRINNSATTTGATSNNINSNNIDGNRTPLGRSFSAPNVKKQMDLNVKGEVDKTKTQKARELNDSSGINDSDGDGDGDDASGEGDNDIIFEDVHSLKSTDLLSSGKIFKPKLRKNSDIMDFDAMEKKLLYRYEI